MNVKAREAHAVAARGIVLIGRPGIVRQHAEQGAAVRLGDVCEQLRREIDVQQQVGRKSREACAGIGKAVRIGKIGLDIKDRCAVHEICP